jgi:N utilization substance protein A
MATKIKLTGEEMRYIALFESVTGAIAKDCIIDDKLNRIVFVVKPGNVGLAVGKQGANVKTLKRMTSKTIELVEYADDLSTFIKHSFAPAKVNEVRITDRSDGKKMVVVMIESKDKGIAIGKNGRNAEKTRFLVKRYFDVDNVVIR